MTTTRENIHDDDDDAADTGSDDTILTSFASPTATDAFASEASPVSGLLPKSRLPEPLAFELAEARIFREGECF